MSKIVPVTTEVTNRAAWLEALKKAFGEQSVEDCGDSPRMVSDYHGAQFKADIIVRQDQKFGMRYGPVAVDTVEGKILFDNLDETNISRAVCKHLELDIAPPKLSTLLTGLAKIHQSAIRVRARDPHAKVIREGQRMVIRVQAG